ncbi:hypothetical protein BKA66DRAFT_447794 [Pyrenochaeta sp. MPI-SDFR-AT-0127]|nr:hypothetical protein BKA66DRAFT_447794 [Pyrenochaeta sp. MPI-SDFR-AT-0127]
MSCQVLTQIRALPVNCLITAALDLLNPAQFQQFCDTHRFATTSVIKPVLAELIYYQLGSNLAAGEKWNDMTRFQLENELRLRELLEEGEVLTDWQLRLRLAGAAFRAKQKAEQQESGIRTPQDDALVPEHDLIGNADACDGIHGEWERKVIYTKNNGKIMVF